MRTVITSTRVFREVVHMRDNIELGRVIFTIHSGEVHSVAMGDIIGVYWD